MFFGKLAIAILVLAITCPHLVTSQRQPICRKIQKLRILHMCRAFTKKGSTIRAVSPQSQCCEEVRKVQNRDMRCVVSILTDKERSEHDTDKILTLETLCEIPLPPPNQNKVKSIVDCWSVSYDVQYDILIECWLILVSYQIMAREGMTITTNNGVKIWSN